MHQPAVDCADPPLFLGYSAARLRWSAMIMNMCLFGAVNVGPLIGGAQASFHAWRPLFWMVVGIEQSRSSPRQHGLASETPLARPVRYGPTRNGSAAGPIQVLSTVRAG
jgi:hypothetical protein